MGYETWRILMDLSDTPLDPFAPRTDITPYVDTIVMPARTQIGATAETTGDPAGGSLVLNDADRRWTPGNVLSPYYPHLVPGRRVWIEDTIGYHTYPVFAGYVDFPEHPGWQPAMSTGGQVDSRVTVPLVDRHAQLARSRELVSLLAEYIMATGSALVGYWPLAETTSGLAIASGPAAVPLLRVDYSAGASPAIASGGRTQVLQQGAGTAVPGDDVTPALWAPIVVSSVPVFWTTLETTALTGAGSSGSGWWTMAAWVRPTLPGVGSQYVLRADTGAADYVELVTDVSSSGMWGVNINGVVRTTAIRVAADVSTLVSLRIQFSSGAAELRVGRLSETWTAATPVTFNPTTLRVGRLYAGCVSHVQLYTGASAATLDATGHAAQWEAGLYGLERQTTGQRIRTVLGYAGVTTGEMGQIDDGTAVMPQGRLAGRAPVDVIRDAVVCEQGQLFFDGAGRPVFRDRRRIYNV